MEWKLIEKKWHEMALRLQTVSPTQRHAQISVDDANQGTDNGSAATPDGATEQPNSDARAMA